MLFVFPARVRHAGASRGLGAGLRFVAVRDVGRGDGIPLTDT